MNLEISHHTDVHRHARCTATLHAKPGREVGWLIPTAKRYIGPLFATLWQVRVEGSEHLPAEGPAIIAANHVSFFDSVALIMAVPRTVSFVGKAEYLESWKTRHVLPALGMIPVDRTSGRQALEALNVAARVLESGGVFGIYPEGTRSRDGELHAGRTGMAHLAVATGVPIIPTGILGTDRIQPAGAWAPRPFRSATVRFGTPIDPDRYPGGRRQRRRDITTDVMAAIQSLSGQRRSATSSDSPSMSF
jgi:1-acyl-sn-glycerol-3-phosphate acyltransferase